MKKATLSLSAIIFILVLFSSCGDSKYHVNGNGNVITKQIGISDYDEIEISTSITLEYSQSANNAPFLEITTDENILDHLYTVVIGRKLIIKPVRNSNRNSGYCNLNPTVLRICTHSSALRGIDNEGSGTVRIVTPIYGNQLEIDIEGSGTVECQDSLVLNELSVDLSGSGKFTSSGFLSANNMDVEISGSGKMDFNGGMVNYGNIDISGSGKFNGLPVIFQRLECDLSGSGKIYATVEQRLDYKISGSGKIYYRGNPIINGNVSGSGSIESVE